MYERNEENTVCTGLRKGLRGVTQGGMWILLVALVVENNNQKTFNSPFSSSSSLSSMLFLGVIRLVMRGFLLEWAEAFSLGSVGAGAGYTGCGFCSAGTTAPFYHPQQRCVGSLHLWILLVWPLLSGLFLITYACKCPCPAFVNKSTVMSSVD